MNPGNLWVSGIFFVGSSALRFAAERDGWRVNRTGAESTGQGEEQSGSDGAESGTGAKQTDAEGRAQTSRPDGYRTNRVGCKGTDAEQTRRDAERVGGGTERPGGERAGWANRAGQHGHDRAGKAANRGSRLHGRRVARTQGNKTQPESATFCGLRPLTHYRMINRVGQSAVVTRFLGILIVALGVVAAPARTGRLAACSSAACRAGARRGRTRRLLSRFALSGRTTGCLVVRLFHDF